MRNFIIFTDHYTRLQINTYLETGRLQMGQSKTHHLPHTKYVRLNSFMTKIYIKRQIFRNDTSFMKELGVLWLPKVHLKPYHTFWPSGFKQISTLEMHYKIQIVSEYLFLLLFFWVEDMENRTLVIDPF